MEAGLDSVGAIELRALLGAKFVAELPATLIFDHPTAAALATYVAGTLEVLPDPALAPSLWQFHLRCHLILLLCRYVSMNLLSCTRTGLMSWLPIFSLRTQPHTFIHVLWQAVQAGPAATEAGFSSGAILARVHVIVERMLGKAIGAHQVLHYARLHPATSPLTQGSAYPLQHPAQGPQLPPCGPPPPARPARPRPRGAPRPGLCQGWHPGFPGFLQQAPARRRLRPPAGKRAGPAAPSGRASRRCCGSARCPGARMPAAAGCPPDVPLPTPICTGYCSQGIAAHGSQGQPQCFETLYKSLLRPGNTVL